MDEDVKKYLEELKNEIRELKEEVKELRKKQDHESKEKISKEDELSAESTYVNFWVAFKRYEEVREIARQRRIVVNSIERKGFFAYMYKIERNKSPKESLRVHWKSLFENNLEKIVFRKALGNLLSSKSNEITASQIREAILEDLEVDASNFLGYKNFVKIVEEVII